MNCGTELFVGVYHSEEPYLEEAVKHTEFAFGEWVDFKYDKFGKNIEELRLKTSNFIKRKHTFTMRIFLDFR